MLQLNALQEIVERATTQRDNLSTEEAAKHALVLPFIQVLGYNIFDPSEIVPEFTADYGHKKGEKVDYAIMYDGQPAILMECKTADDPLDGGRASQLSRYFHTTTARIAVLTNGVVYKFFSDLDTDNVMDETPFYVVDITHMGDRDLESLNHFTKQAFDMDKACTVAADMKYIRGIKTYLRQMYTAPDAQFVKLLAREVCPGRLMTRERVAQFTALVKLGFQGFTSDFINETLQRASDIANTAYAEADEDSNNPEVDDSAAISEPDSKRNIITTVEEIEGYEMIKSIISTSVDPERIAMRDTLSYCGVLLDDSNRKTICRMYFNSKNVKYLEVFNEDKSKNRYRLESVNDITHYADHLRAAVSHYLQN